MKSLGGTSKKSFFFFFFIKKACLQIEDVQWTLCATSMNIKMFYFRSLIEQTQLFNPHNYKPNFEFLKNCNVFANRLLLVYQSGFIAGKWKILHFYKNDTLRHPKIASNFDTFWLCWILLHFLTSSAPKKVSMPQKLRLDKGFTKVTKLWSYNAPIRFYWKKC